MMHAMLPRLETTDFPSITRGALETLQVNLGYKCNLHCHHCHVNASPRRKEAMDEEIMDDILCFIKKQSIRTLDLTGGAPEMNPHFESLVKQSRALGVKVIDRCNLTILNEPGYEHMAQFLADEQVEVVASLPCYLEDNVDQQRGDGVFQSSIIALKKLNQLGYGKADSGLSLNLVYNPISAILPPGQMELENAYKEQLAERFGIVFNHLFTITNMPIARFGSQLVEKGEFEHYMMLLKNSYNPSSLDSVMCRSTLSVDYQGNVYDCDFNQMLSIPLGMGKTFRTHIKELINEDTQGKIISIADHCYGCTAGQGSSCGGALS